MSEKARVHARVPEPLKEQVDTKLNGSSLTYSQLVEGALKEFLSQYNEKLECSCGAKFHANVLLKSDGNCPKCDNEVKA